MISSIYLLYQVLAVSHTSQAVSTAPIGPLLSAAGGNRTTLRTQISPPWVSYSEVRGTPDILWSCILTLTACVYTAIHLNVPPPQEGKWQFLWRKSKWVALALFAPEIVLYCAVTQRVEARNFIKEMNDLWATQHASLDHPERKESKLAAPDAPHRNDDLNVVELDHLAPSTQQDQAPSEISPLPLPKPSALKSEETTKDDDIHPSSSHNTRDEISSQPSQRPLSISSKRDADGQFSPKGPDLEKAMITSPSQKFSLEYGFLVVMGGIATHDVAKISDSVNGPVVLTPDAVIQFARRGVFFDISQGIISDKSKANLLGKGLVCIQVIWFLIQCIARTSARYPLALLEVHTVVHVVCALLMYALWWEKPQDVSEPAVQDVSGDMDLLAALLAMSAIPSYSGCEALKLVWYGKTALQDPLLDRPSNERQCSSLGPSDPRCEVKVLRKKNHSQNLQSFDRSKGQVVALVPGQALSCGIGPELYKGDTTTYLSAKDVLRWTKLSEWLDKYEQRIPRHEVAISPHITLYFQLTHGQSGERVPRDALSVHVSDLSGDPSVILDSELWMDAMSFVVKTKVLLTLLVALPLVYGGIHLTTWSFHFASLTEQLLWKIACIDIMGTIPLGVTFYASVFTISDIRFRNQVSTDRIMAMYALALYVSWIIFAPMFILYALSRIYIVVESFISLRHVPIGVYAAIPWVQDIPHI